MPKKSDDYRKQAQERLKQAQANRPVKIPNLAQADVQYKPSRDGSVTMQKLAMAQENMQGAAPLSPDTVRGLMAIKEQSDKERQMQAPVGPPGIEEIKPAEAEPPKAEKAGPPINPEHATKANEEAKLEDTLRRLDDLEFGQLMNRVQEDVINNKKEREAVAKRVKPIDFADGLSNGVFTQDVPINQNMTVTFRTVSTEEHKFIRAKVVDSVIKDPRLEQMSAEIYGMMLVVAGVVQINGRRFPSHTSGSAYDFTIDEKVFDQKVSLFARYPAPLVHALSTHNFWFDQRVREMFTSDFIKNG